MTNALYFGDNLEVLRESIKDESVDLIYLDPPFNSNASYNVLFKAPDGHDSDAQIEAFDDTWHWGPQAQHALTDAIEQGNTNVADVLNALRSVLGDNDMMAYLAMMTVRLIEMHRVLKPTGSLYLHCDPTASHYLKIVLDQVFGVESFQNEIIWLRATPRGHAFTRFPSNHDVILLYAKGEAHTWNQAYTELRDAYVESHYAQMDEQGRKYQLTSLINPNRNRPNLTYEFPPGSGVTRVWRWTRERMLQAYDDGLVVIPQSGGVARYKRYLDEQLGTPVTSVWTDISPINSQAQERLGYPTQKPLALLERIIRASSKEGDVVLDPFCGCGTAVDAAATLKRNWIGIDVTHLAIGLVERRMRDRHKGTAFEVYGRPEDIDGARDLAFRDKHQFQLWACSLLEAHNYKGGKKGADTGIDGLIYFQDDPNSPSKKIVVSVKGGENVGVAMIRDFAHVIDREKAAIGLFVTLTDPTRHMVTEGVGTGYYTSPLTGTKFPKLQVLTIDGLLSGRERASYPRMDAGGLTFRKAKEAAPEQKNLL